MVTILVTGGRGFIGSHFIRLLLKKTDYLIVNLDLVTYAGQSNNLSDLESNTNYHFVKGDIADPNTVDRVFSNHNPAIVVNFAAESHVDRSVTNPLEFVRTNVLGTQVLLDACRKYKTRRFVQVSTDEVYGSLGPTGLFTEQTPIQPNSPYSASKASADMLVRAAVHTHNLDCVITRCSNNYGPYQYPEKLIPLIITNAMQDKPLPVYGDGKNVRDWIYVEDHCEGIFSAMIRGFSGEVYNFGGNAERENIYVIKEILRLLGKPESLITYVTDRPGHDRRYAMDSTKAKLELNWEPKYTFEEGLKLTVDWYKDNA